MECLQETQPFQSTDTKAVIGSLSGEMRNNLHTIFVSLSFLKNNLRDKDYHRLEQIESAAYCLLRLCINLTEYANFATKGNTQLKPINMTTLYYHIADALDTYFIDKPICYHYSIERSVPECCPVLCDIRLTRIAIYNLISNACKYGRPEYGLTLSLKSTRNNVSITVKDSGPGLPRDIMSNPYSIHTDGIGGCGSGLGFCVAACCTHVQRGQLLTSFNEGTAVSITYPTYDGKCEEPPNMYDAEDKYSYLNVLLSDYSL